MCVFFKPTVRTLGQTVTSRDRCSFIREDFSALQTRHKELLLGVGLCVLSQNVQQLCSTTIFKRERKKRNHTTCIFLIIISHLVIILQR